RSYSIASVPTVESQLELHIARVPQGRMSGWVYQNLRQNDELTISPALGECYYRAESPDQALLLIGTGTGLAPLYGVLRDALRQGHRGEIYLYHGSSTPQGLYLEETLHQLAAHHANFHYFPCVSQGSASAQYAHGRADALALQTLTNLRGMRVYLCGHPAMVRSAQRAVFLGGASMTDIVADAFLSPS
ncbi:MAG: oxygenase, partial [Gammaproteobacteria bacterium]|nr:oxygenase [Gammaproteobacteria bacterium]